MYRTVSCIDRILSIGHCKILAKITESLIYKNECVVLFRYVQRIIASYILPNKSSQSKILIAKVLDAGKLFSHIFVTLAEYSITLDLP